MSTARYPSVYVASRASVPERSAMWRGLRAKGAAIVSTWIDAEEESLACALGALWTRIQCEVAAADRLVLYAEMDDFPLKGAFVEVGMALALGKPVFVVTPGVLIDPSTMRPLGSWAAHPLVRFCVSVEEAMFGKPDVAMASLEGAADV